MDDGIRPNCGSAVVRELQGDAEVLLLEGLDDRLEVVPGLAGHPEAVALHLALDLDGQALDELVHRAGLLLVDALHEGDLLLVRAGGGRLALALLAGPGRHAPAEPPL